eukprot:997062-Pelagomonas_calceolata.AAC.3
MEEQVRLGTLAIPGTAAKLRSRIMRGGHQPGECKVLTIINSIGCFTAAKLQQCTVKDRHQASALHLCSSALITPQLPSSGDAP